MSILRRGLRAVQQSQAEQGAEMHNRESDHAGRHSEERRPALLLGDGGDSVLEEGIKGVQSWIFWFSSDDLMQTRTMRLE